MYSIRIRQLLQCLILSVALSIIKAKSSTYLTPTGWQQSPQDFQFENDDAQVVLPESSDSIEISSHRNYEKEIARCGKDDNKILLSFILRSNQWNEVSDKKKERAINKLSNFFAVQKNFISLDNVSRKEVFEMTQHSSRRGLSQPSTKSNRKLGRMQFMIGCGTNLFPVGELISNQIAEQMLDGSINEICGLDFGMWIIWSKPVDSRLARSKRQTDEGSGELNDADDDDYNDDYYEDEDEEQDEEVTEDIPVEQPTVQPKHKNRHHHGEKDEDDALDTPDETPTEKSISQSDHSKHLAFNEYFGQQKTTTGSPPSSASVDQIVPIIDTINPTVPDSEYGDYDDIIDEDDENELSTPTSPTTTTTTIASTTSQRTIPKFMIETTTLSTTEVTTTEPSTTPTLPPFNSPPFIKNRMPKQALPVGKPFSLKLSDDIFYDEEDSLLNIELLDEHNNNLDANSWVQFNDKTNEIYGLPLENSVSNWIYHLRASDSGGKSVIEAVDLTVQQNKYHRSENHEISIGIKLLKKFTLHVDWQIHLIRGIAEVLNEKSTSNILVREIINGAQDSNEYTFVYSNETIPKPGCPEKELEDILKVLTASALTKSLAPEIAVRSVQAELISVCKKTTQVPKKEDAVSGGENSRPFPRNPVDSVIATVGQLLIFKVPSDTFFDKEDPVLSLSLLTSERAPLDPKNWLQFDSKNNEFYGIPKYPDIGQKEYLLIAEDRGGLAGYDALIVTVKPANKRDYSLAIEIPIGVPYDAFNSLQQRRFVEQILEIFNETSTSHIRIQSIRPFQNYSIVSFYNTTMFKIHHRCPDDEIEALKNIYVSSDGSLRSNVKKQLADFNVNSISFIPKGPCQGFDPIHHEPIIPIKANEPTSPKSVQDDYLLTFVLPAVIILSMLLLASIIACYLHRRRLRGKMELGDEEERRSFRSKGIPVIFQDELDEKPEIGNKSPIILKNEKPPLLPPSYTSTNPDDNEDMDDYVPPPAVMMGGRESRGKSPVTPSYRKPPPYVSP